MDLPYKYEDLEPYLDAQTVEIHHDRHHQTYVNNLNNLIQETELENLTLEEILVNIDKADIQKQNGINNNAGGVYLHNLYFGQFSKTPQAPSTNFLKEIEKNFASFEEMQTEIINTGLTTFGSGWTILAYNKNSAKLEIKSIGNQNAASLLTENIIPIMGIDVWEHAYYLKYQNARPKYLEQILKVVDWSIVENNYNKIK